MVGAASDLLVKLAETRQIQQVNKTVDQAYWVVFRNIYIDSLRKKLNLFGSVGTKVYLCHDF